MYAKKPKNRSQQQQVRKGYPRPLDDALYATPSDFDDTEISLTDIFGIIAHFRWVILGAMLLVALVATTAAFLLTPQYRADILVQPVSEADEQDQYAGLLGQLGGIANLTGIKMDSRESKYKSIATLKSRQFTEQFIEQDELLPILFADLWDQDAERWLVDDKSDVPTLLDAYEVFDKTVRRVTEDRMTGMVTLSISWSDPQLAADWANRMIQEVNEALRREVVDDSNKAIVYLQAQLKQTSVVELQDVLHRLIESEMKEAILANINDEYAFRVIDPAVVPERPSSPKIVPLSVLGLVVGALVGLIIALILNYLRVTRTYIEE